MKKACILALTTLLAAAMLFSACDLLSEPFSEETETNSDILIDPNQTELESNIHIDPAQTEAETTDSSDIPVQTTTAWGCIRDKKDGLLLIKLSSEYKGERGVMVYVRAENPDAFSVGLDVFFSYDANRPAETAPTGEDILIADSVMEAPMYEKPVIYLYPDTPTEVSVKLTLDGRLTCTYPAYDKGWDNFVAHPDGTLVFPDGKQYYCLYWEGIQNMDCDFSKGFCVKGEDTATFLEWSLAQQGLTPREANEFIIYWLPRMEGNPYNVISFQTEAYTEGAVLDIEPNPDSLLRVFMAWYPSDVVVKMEAQEFASFERVGFTVVEWGGCELARH